VAVGTGGGLDASREACQHYGQRARELHAAGRRIIGYLCAYVPLEIITAAGLVPFRIKGDAKEPINAADALMENIVCGRVRSCFDLSLKGRYEFLDGLVIPHACDSIARTYAIWQHTLKLPYSHFLDIPHGTDSSSLAFFKSVLNTFRESLGRFSGCQISDEALAMATLQYNRNRAAIRDLYELRRSEPPLISGSEVTTTLVAGASLPVEESTFLVQRVVAEVVERPPVQTAKKPRIMVVGGEVDDSFIRIVEATGANVVHDDLCPGGRENLFLADLTPNPVDGITLRYLRKIGCPRTCSEGGKNYAEYLRQRFGDIESRARSHRVDGVILYFYRYCDPFGFEVPALKGYLDSLGVPVLCLEDEYSMWASARLTTRIQAFLEMIGSR
jgi:bcr-type benzoyl-CoA reductase subunit C